MTPRKIEIFSTQEVLYLKLEVYIAVSE